jgi:putative transcriptional regulator
MDFFKYKTKVKPGPGKLLVSEPFLPDPNFERTIILLCEHNDEGSFGFVLNKPANAQVADVLDELAAFNGMAHVGGPVQQDTLQYVHRLPDIDNSIEIMRGVYWGGKFKSICQRINTGLATEQDIKFFLGYSGWAAGQLNEELKENVWIVSQHVDTALIFETQADNMWQKALQLMGGRFSVYSNYPVDPRMN